MTVGAAMVVAAPADAIVAHCGQLISHNSGLENDLSGCSGTGLAIGADGVVLDLRGHTVSGRRIGTSTGIDVAGHSGVTIKNGNVSRFGVGIAVTGDDNRVVDTRSNENVHFGVGITGFRNVLSSSVQVGDGFGAVEVDGSDNQVLYDAAKTPGCGTIGVSNGSGNVVANSLVFGSTRNECFPGGITLTNEHGDSVRDNRVEGGVWGITVDCADDVQVARNRVTGADDGFVIDESKQCSSTATSGVSATGNSAQRNSNAGFLVGATAGEPSLGDRFAGNTAQRNGVGFWLQMSTDAVLDGNVAGSTNRLSSSTSEHNSTGILVDGQAVGALVERNGAHHNLLDGIRVAHGATGTQLLDDVANYNGGNGILEQSGSTQISANTTLFNSLFGINATPGDTGSGNHSHGNTAGQCANISCSP